MPNQCLSCIGAGCLALAGAILVVSLPLHAGPVRVAPGGPSQLPQAVELLGKGMLKQADELFEEITEREPGQLDAALGRAQIAVDQQRLDDADRMVAAVLQRRDTLPEAHNMKGLILLLRKDPDGARHEFLRAIELHPGYVAPRLYLAVMARTSGDYTGAAAQYKAITVVAPRLPAGYLGQAESLMLLHQEALALRILDAWKTADPKSLLPYQVVAKVNLADNQPGKAIQQLHAALARNPHDSATLTILGSAYAATGNTGAATDQYEAALAADGANTEAAIRLGSLEAATDKTGPALAHFRAALKADPDNVVAGNNIAWLLAKQGKDLDEALRLSTNATTRNPKYADAFDTLGWVRYRRGEYAAAVTALERAKALAPSSTDIATHLSLAYQKTGRTREARAEVKRAGLPRASASDPAQSKRPSTQPLLYVAVGLGILALCASVWRFAPRNTAN